MKFLGLYSFRGTEGLTVRVCGDDLDLTVYICWICSNTYDHYLISWA